MVDGKLYKINSDFRTSIQFEILMQKKELTEKQKEFANELCLLDIRGQNISDDILNQLYDKIIEQTSPQIIIYFKIQ